MRKMYHWLQHTHWSLYAAAWIFGISILGGVLGLVLFPLGGLIVGAERSTTQLLIRGARFGSFWFFIWAPAIAITACVMRAYRRKHPDAEKNFPTYSPPGPRA